MSHPISAHLSMYRKQNFKDHDCVIISTDRDFFQLISERVVVWSPGSKKEWSSELKNASLDAGMPVTVELGEIETTLSVLKNLRVGDTIDFKKPEHARVMVNDMPVFTADVGSSGTQVAIKLVNALEPPANHDD